MRIKKMLFVTQFNELRFDVLRSFLDLRKAELGHIVLLNVIERESVSMKRGTGYHKEAEVRLREKANIRFIDWAETLFEEGMEVGVHIVVGKFDEQVIKAAITEEVDLIVVSSEKKKYLEKFYLGSNINKIIKKTRKPLLIYKNRSYEKSVLKNNFIRPLLLINWLIEYNKIINYIEGIKSVIDQIDVVHVISEKELKGSSSMFVQKTRKNTRQKLEAVCDKIRECGVMANSHVYVGDILFEVDKAVKERESSIVILGYPKIKKTIWENYWNDNAKNEIVEKVNLPVLLLPSE